METQLQKVKLSPASVKLENPMAHLAMLITVLLWGSSYISIKTVVMEVPPATMALVRFLLASAILLTILRTREPKAKLQKEDLPKMAAAGLFGIALYFILENTGLKYTTASNASLVASIIPILAILLDMIIFRSKVSLLQIIGIVGSVVGTYLAVTVNGQVDFSSGTFKGNMLMVGAMLSWTAYTLMNKSLNSRYTGLQLITYQTVIGTMLLVLPALLEYREWQVISLKAAVNILFLAVFCSAVCYLLYVYALKKLDVTQTTVYLNLVPIVGVVSGCVLLRESILWPQAVGGVLILVSIVLVYAGRNKGR